MLLFASVMAKTEANRYALAHGVTRIRTLVKTSVLTLFGTVTAQWVADLTYFQLPQALLKVRMVSMARSMVTEN